jgi:hypothetical protein
MTPSALESGLAKLRTQAAAPNWPVPAHITSQEAAALLAELQRLKELPYTNEMGDAGDRYIRSVAFNGTYYLPARFRWSDLWDVMLRAYRAPQPAGEDK